MLHAEGNLTFFQHHAVIQYCRRQSFSSQPRITRLSPRVDVTITTTTVLVEVVSTNSKNKHPRTVLLQSVLLPYLLLQLRYVYNLAVPLSTSKQLVFRTRTTAVPRAALSCCKRRRETKTMTALAYVFYLPPTFLHLSVSSNRYRTSSRSRQLLVSKLFLIIFTCKNRSYIKENEYYKIFLLG